MKFRAKAKEAERQSAHGRAGGRVQRHLTAVGDLAVVDAAGEQALRTYVADPAVEYVERDQEVSAALVPGDPLFAQLWNMVAIQAPAAWDLTVGDPGVVVATLDTGIDYTHPDLAGNTLLEYGLDRVNRDTDPMDDNWHGTHVAGTIGALGNNDLGVVGVNWQIGLVACKFLGANASGWLSDAVTCLNHIAETKDRGVNVIATNNSWVASGFSKSLFDAVRAHLDRGILFIAAAGNNGRDNDVKPTYPASFALPNVISVAASDPADTLYGFSNYGRRTVHLAAPGSVLSTLPGARYGWASGTSMATPHVTGVAALLKSWNPALDWRGLRALLLTGGDPMPGATVSGRRLNAAGSLLCADRVLLRRVLPVADAVSVLTDTPVDLSAIHLNCERPFGEVQVTVEPTGERFWLLDGGWGDGTYSGRWSASAPGTYRLVLEDGDAVSVAVAEPPRSLLVVSPNGGERFRMGQTVTLRWSSSYVPGEVALDWAADGKTWQSVTSATANSGTYSWVVPRVRTTAGLVRVRSLRYPAVVDVSNGPFTIK